MKNIYYLLISLCICSIVSAQQINDPNAEIRQAKNYHGINVSNAFNIYLSQGNDETVAVSAADISDRNLITVEVKDGILYVGMVKGTKWKGGNKKLKAYISFIKLDNLTVSGACDVFVSGSLKADELKISQSGASDFKGNLDVNKLTVELSGASDMKVSGNAIQVSVEASGASSFKGYELTAETCNLRASGSSDLKITANKEISAHASGASDIRYRGSADIKELKSSGASSVSRG